MILLRKVFSIYSYLANLGIDPTGKADQKNKKLMNILCLIWYHASIIFVVSESIFSHSLGYPVILHAITSIAVSSLVHFLNVYGHTDAAKLLFIGFGLAQNMLFGIFIAARPGKRVIISGGA
ncbi:hypothetical protein [Tunicatimonas pelagia]|uniref:hypothetical protein n=1 Tax=Tunicatimonas pelagia TaxID=931531 RepID=UPI002666D75F|nr:hypothetical protein [Tunicatimonas pelagia]WKN43116.1 hypothetical protein P0M28_29175 [Tunicatimonas pelagia]